MTSPWTARSTNDKTLTPNLAYLREKIETKGLLVEVPQSRFHLWFECVIDQPPLWDGILLNLASSERYQLYSRVPTEWLVLPVTRCLLPKNELTKPNNPVIRV